ncbi:MAG: ABC transporter ATP-binding protein [Acidimicrobiia bacterium]
MSLIEVDRLRKDFRIRQHRPGVRGALVGVVRPRSTVKRAIEDVSFTVEAGEIVAYLGPNGAGKSTTVKCLVGILTPTGGSVRVSGRDPVRERTRSAGEIGVVFGQKTTLWWDVAVIETYRLLQRIYDVPAGQFEETLDLLRLTLGIDEFEEVPVRQLSLGQRMRADLAAALLHQPRLLFLDEPTIGLDVVGKQQLRGFIKEINALRNVTVLLTTHDMQDVELLCDRIIVIDEGRLMFDGGRAQMIERWVPWTTVVLDLAGDAPPIDVPGIEEVKRQDRRCWARFRRSEFTLSEVTARLAACLPVRDFRVEEPTIESIVKEIYSGSVLAPNGHGRVGRG